MKDQVHTSCVYFFYSPSARRGKIGITTNFENRLVTLRNASGLGDLTLVRWFYNDWFKNTRLAGPDSRKSGGKHLEKVFHHCFHFHRLQGEWFDWGEPIQEFVDSTQDKEHFESLISKINLCYEAALQVKVGHQIGGRTITLEMLHKWNFKGNNELIFKILPEVLPKVDPLAAWKLEQQKEKDEWRNRLMTLRRDYYEIIDENPLTDDELNEWDWKRPMTQDEEAQWRKEWREYRNCKTPEERDKWFNDSF